jgi:hypothetical protein
MGAVRELLPDFRDESPRLFFRMNRTGAGDEAGFVYDRLGTDGAFQSHIHRLYQKYRNDLRRACNSRRVILFVCQVMRSSAGRMPYQND